MWRKLAVGALIAAAISGAAQAEVNEVRMSKQFGLPYLPMIVIEAQQLIEKNAKAAGPGDVKTSWTQRAGPAAELDALLAGQADFIGPGAPTLATIWDKTVGTPQEARALIAMQSLLTGQTVNSHFAVAPFNYYELRVPGIHKMLNSYETDGKHTNGIQVTTKAFHDANPKICTAVRAAHEEANAFIKREPKAAAEIYLKLTNDKKNSADDLVKMITDPDIDYTTAPANLMKHVEFMHKVGRLKRMPTSWKDMFFAEAHDLKGS